MQTNKSRAGSLDVPQKPSFDTSKTQKLKAPGSDPDSAPSPHPTRKTPKDRSPKVVDRRSPRPLAAEKKRSNKVSELEAQIAQLQEELKKAKDQLSSSESCKRRAQQEAGDTKKQLASMTAELDETQRELKELSECEEARVQELRKISQERDRAWQSELEAVQKHHSMDSAALASAMNEIQKLKMQLDRVYQSEASQARHAESAHAEIRSLRLELTETLVLVEKLKDQLNESRDSETQAVDEVSRAQTQLKSMKTTQETLQAERANALEAYNSLWEELEQSKNRVNSLEELVANLRADLDNHSKMSAYPSAEVKTSSENEECDQSEVVKTELKNLKTEASQLSAALEAAERRYQDECTQGTLQLRNAYELVEQAKLESSQREAELEARLKECRAEVEELRTKLIESESTLRSISPNDNKAQNLKLEDNQPADTEVELKKSDSMLEGLKASLQDAEARLRNIIEENEMLKSEIMKSETERSKASDEALALAEAARAAEQAALMKLGSLTKEADKNCRKAAWVTEQLDAAQATNSGMEAELRRLKVQADQWRKAAEAATGMLYTDNQGKFVERMGSFDYPTTDTKLSSPRSEDTDDESPKKRNGNMLKKIGVLLKKGQK